MKYFIANLSAHFMLLIILIVLEIIFSNRNRKRKNKYAFTFLLPTVTAVMIIIYTWWIIGPRLLDITDVVAGTYQSYTGTLERKSFFNNYVVIDGQKYYYNPLHNIPDSGESVRVLYTHNSNFAMSVEPAPVVEVEENTEEES